MQTVVDSAEVSLIDEALELCEYFADSFSEITPGNFAEVSEVKAGVLWSRVIELCEEFRNEFSHVPSAGKLADLADKGLITEIEYLNRIASAVLWND